MFDDFHIYCKLVEVVGIKVFEIVHNLQLCLILHILFSSLPFWMGKTLHFYYL